MALHNLIQAMMLAKKTSKVKVTNIDYKMNGKKTETDCKRVNVQNNRTF